MKAKIKESNKDINIDIVIENNMLSKNKMVPPSEKKEPVEQKPNAKSGVHPNSSMSRLLSEYYGAMSQRDLYRQNQSVTPFNLNQYLTAPNAPPHTMNQNLTGYTMNTAGNNDQLMIEELDEEENDELLNTTVVPGSSDQENEEEPPSTQPQVPIITKQQLFRSIIDNPDKEKAFVDQNSSEWKNRRNELIERIIDENSYPRLYLKKTDVITYKLGRYVQMHRIKKWKSMLKSSN